MKAFSSERIDDGPGEDGNNQGDVVMSDNNATGNNVHCLSFFLCWM